MIRQYHEIIQTQRFSPDTRVESAGYDRVLKLFLAQLSGKQGRETVYKGLPALRECGTRD